MNAETLPALPPSVNLGSKCILKRVSDANRELACSKILAGKFIRQSGSS